MRFLADDACTFDRTIATDTAVSIGDMVIATETGERSPLENRVIGGSVFLAL